MRFSTLIDANILKEKLNDPDWVVVDCRFSLTNPDFGPTTYRRGHLPKSRYAHLDKDLSSIVSGFTGRHPLPNIKQFSEKLGLWGITNKTQVVAYDDVGGAFAARLWWLLRWLGHDSVAVLDGGINGWQAQNLPIVTTLPVIRKASYRPYRNDSTWLSATDLQNALALKSICLIDARTQVRFRGELEPIDPVAGHIPGAVNHPMQANLTNNLHFLPPTELRNQFQSLMGNKTAEQTVHMCGSGVTACHNLLAMEYAGLSGSKLYAGSWSEWIKNKNRAVASGNA